MKKKIRRETLLLVWSKKKNTIMGWKRMWHMALPQLLETYHRFRNFICLVILFSLRTVGTDKICIIWPWYVFLMIAFSVGNAGILSEAKWLLDMGLEPNSNSATRAIGYRQVYTGLCLSPFCLSLSFYTEIVTHSCLNTFECSLGGIGVILVQILN